MPFPQDQARTLPHFDLGEYEHELALYNQKTQKTNDMGRKSVLLAWMILVSAHHQQHTQCTVLKMHL